MKPTKCERGIHKFRARYDEVPNNDLTKRGFDAWGHFRDILYYNVYVYDICVKCGVTIKRDDR